MARGKRHERAFAPGVAKYILEAIVRDGKVEPATIEEYERRHADEANGLLQRLRDLGIDGLQVIKGGGSPPQSASTSGATKRSEALTPEQLASRQLQGRYLGLIKKIPPDRRGQFQSTAKEKGREAAIKEMQSFLSQLGATAAEPPSESPKGGGSKKGGTSRERVKRK